MWPESCSTCGTAASCRWETSPEVIDGPAEVDSYTFHGRPGEAPEADGEHFGVQAAGR